ncbi:hypothetical protein LZ30DRAFT_690155 [Colletotrichum cereale]|nr:hypothetical protein LZ30DRAFT_690155 [Colletotrichum cereale]
MANHPRGDKAGEHLLLADHLIRCNASKTSHSNEVQSAWFAGPTFLRLGSAGNQASGAKEVYLCPEPGCTSNPFSTKANLKRHYNSKHGPLYKTPCGKLLRNHTSNNQRHVSTCRKCQAGATPSASSARVPPPVSPSLDPQHNPQHNDPWYVTPSDLGLPTTGDRMPDVTSEWRADPSSFGPLFDIAYEQQQLQHQL